MSTFNRTRTWTSRLRRQCSRLASGARLHKGSSSLEVIVGQAQSIGSAYDCDINIRTIQMLLHALSLLGQDVFATFPPPNRDLCWRSRVWFPNQCWSFGIGSQSSSAGQRVTDDATLARQSDWVVEYSAAVSALESGVYAIPYGMHPHLVISGLDAMAPRLRHMPRQIGVLFAGAFEQSLYDQRALITGIYNKLTRHQLLTHLRANREVIFVECQPALDALLDGSARNSVVVIDRHKVNVPVDRWLSLLASADYFLAPPGQIMPICHNIIEAVAVGTVPITNYPEWLANGGRPQAPVVTFSTETELDAAIDSALSTPFPKRDLMRKAVEQWYDGCISPGAIGHALRPLVGSGMRLRLIDETYARVKSLGL